MRIPNVDKVMPALFMLATGLGTIGALATVIVSIDQGVWFGVIAVIPAIALIGLFLIMLDQFVDAKDQGWLK